MTPSLCRRCILPSTFPGIRFDDEGLCQWCGSGTPVVDFEDIRRKVEAMVRPLLRSAPHYDIVLAFSGGKDSTYTLQYLKETFQARVLALTVDNDFVSDEAYENCLRVTAALGVDHIFFKPNPSAMMEIYRESLVRDFHSRYSMSRATAICNSCISVINTQVMTFASNYDVPIVAGGYVGGQVPTESGFMRRNLDLLEPVRRPFLEKVSKALSPDSFRLFQQRRGTRNEVLMINPLTYLNLSESDILAAIASLGWVKPADTGRASTNCLLNDYAIQAHEKVFQFHPYVFELATLVRRGLLARENALAKLDVHFSERESGEIERKLGLSPRSSAVGDV